MTAADKAAYQAADAARKVCARAARRSAGDSDKDLDSEYASEADFAADRVSFGFVAPDQLQCAAKLSQEFSLRKMARLPCLICGRRTNRKHVRTFEVFPSNGIPKRTFTNMQKRLKPPPPEDPIEDADSLGQPSAAYPAHIVDYYNLPRKLVDLLSESNPQHSIDTSLFSEHFDNMLLYTGALHVYESHQVHSESSVPTEPDITVVTHICTECFNSVTGPSKANNPPKFAIANGLAFGACPVLATSAEWRMVTLCVPKLLTVSVMHNPKRSVLKSHTFLNEQRPGPPATVIPRPFSETGAACKVVFAPLCTPKQKVLELRQYQVRPSYLPVLVFFTVIELLHSSPVSLFQVRIATVLELARWLKVNNHVYAGINIQDKPEDFGLHEPKNDDERLNGVMPDVLVDLANSPDADPSVVSASSLPVDTSESALNNHANVSREDDVVLDDLRRQSDGCVHIRQHSTFVADDTRRVVGAADGLMDGVHRMQSLLQVSDSRAWANEFDRYAWCRSHAELFPNGR